MNIEFKSLPQWRKYEKDGVIFYQAGAIEQIETLAALMRTDNLDRTTLHSFLLSQKECFGIIAKTGERLLAAVDRVRTYPIFYHEQNKNISNAAQSLAPKLSQEKLDQQAALEFAMAGYTIGTKTLHQDVRMLKAGEYLCNDNGTFKTEKFFDYRPSPLNAEEPILLGTLSKVMDNAITRTIRYANGRTICVPLSGGLDSRIVLAKLKEHGYPKLVSFSYGMPDNFEARMAKKVAAMLDVPWKMVPSMPDHAQELYHSPERKKFEEYAHNYCAIPPYTEFEAFNTVKRDGLIPEDSVIVNGQAGDFITGGHIKEIFYDAPELTKKIVFDFIIGKHFALWLPLQTPENLERIRREIEPYFEKSKTRSDFMRDYENFEWQERQVKMVAHGQRVYEYFGYDWHLPLWDSEIVDLFEKVSFDQKQGQKLYKTYLKSYNYCGVFNFLSAKPEPWPKGKRWIPWVGRTIQIIKGSKAKEDFYKKMLYFGDSHHQYAFFGKKRYYREYRKIRNFISMTIEDFFKDMSLPFPKGVQKDV